MNHTKTPWQWQMEGETVAFLVESDGTTIAKLSATENSTAHSQLAANANRIVACVNACDGISTETLKQGSTLAKITKAASDELAAARNIQGNIADRIARLEQQRDELLTALEGLCELAALRPGHLQDYKQAVTDARAAIASVKDGAA